MARKSRPIRRTKDAAKEDIWLRHLIFDMEVTASGEVHPSVFSRLLESAQGMPWKHGISGRLKSLASNIPQFADEHARSYKSRKPHLDVHFRGLIHSSVRSIEDHDSGSYKVVHFVDDPKDPAHAGMVRYTKMPTIRGVVPHQVVRELVAQFTYLAAGSAALHMFLSSK